MTTSDDKDPDEIVDELSAEEAKKAQELNLQLLALNHSIRQTEHHLDIARRRKKWSNLSLVFGPLLAVLLYAVWWISWIPREILLAIYAPMILVIIGFCIAVVHLKKYPGGPSVQAASKEAAEALPKRSRLSQLNPISWFRRHRDKERMSEGDLELQLAKQRDSRKLLIASVEVPQKVRRVTYKEDAYTEVDKLRKESTKNRTTNNTLQGIVIIGSLAATGLSGLAAEIDPIHLAVLTTTFIVGISSGFMGYFKYKERSFYLQQTADAIESEWEAVEVGVGRYKDIKTERDRLAAFVEEVHRLKSEQKKRQQNLEQPPEIRNPNE